MLCIVLVFMLGLWFGQVSLLQLLPQQSDTAWLIVQDIRLPRLLLGLLVGATLGLAGAVLQGLLRNPLADPSVIGVSSGAAFGAVCVFYFGFMQYGQFMLPLGGMLGAVLSLAALYVLAGRNPDVTTLILAGVAINSFTAAMTALALNLAPNPYAAMEILFWLMGSLADRSLQDLYWIAPFILLGWVLLLNVARALDSLSLGEEVATSLGFNMGWIKVQIMLGTALCVGAAVALSGNIGFVGLIIPHLCRPLVAHQPSRLLVVSALAGALLLLAADLVVRLISLDSGELKLGVVTALLGAPFFLWLIIKRRSAWI
ncbi:iron ABC transporter permease [Candidatus Albibeggiatoa sp. nov. NOAA]|uniref:FecCD family ABC transporter permease n=1 Tax=Candidatus Albibeggiatoa sp. nov. NOAA TaxID=3162724 RepID=UPI0032FEA3C5|nr:iron ABC transporter permease [Thiotrichaceae bacterium]